jgi:RNA polymerase sigma factor (TIGR02999 family)
MPDVTVLLQRWQRKGDKAALDEMLPAVYDELKKLAVICLAHERPGHTLQPTELVHEAYMRLIGQREVDWRDRAHFLGVAAQTIRRVLLHHARDRMVPKREGYAHRLPLDLALDSLEREATTDIVTVNAALDRLAAKDPRQAQVVELRIFGGLTTDETAEVMSVSAATVKRDWVSGVLWLRRELA